MIDIDLAIDFNIDSKFNNKASEYNITYRPQTQKMDKLIDFLDYADKRVNVRFVSDLADDEVLVPEKDIDAMMEHDNCYIRLDSYNYPDYSEYLIENDYRFFYDYTMAAYNWISLSKYVNNHPTDIYIVDDLVYDLWKVKKYCDDSNVRLRVILNKIPSWNLDIEDPKTPIYTPNSYEYLNNFYNTAEFVYDSELQLEALYKIWFVKHRWKSNLQEINNELTFELDNRCLSPMYVESRSECGLKCIKGGTCRKCHEFIKLAETLKSKGWEWNDNFDFKTVIQDKE